MSKAKHRGLREYTSDEAGNAALGQLGFTNVTGTTVGYFNCVKVIGGAAAADVDISLVSSQGDDIALTEVLTGEILYGTFTSVAVTNADASVKVLAYYAK
jgi:hypothetical protein